MHDICIVLPGFYRLKIFIRFHEMNFNDLQGCVPAHDDFCELPSDDTETLSALFSCCCRDESL